MSPESDVNIDARESTGIHIGVSRPTTGRSPMIHLAMLVALLALVIWAMFKARNPDSWKWMGFSENPAKVDSIKSTDDAANNINDGQIKTEKPANNNPPLREADTSNDGKINAQLLSEIRSHFDQTNRSNLIAASNKSTGEAVLSHSFWRQVFEHMSSSQRMLIQSMLLRENSAEPGKGNGQTGAWDPGKAKELITYLDRQRLAFDATILRETADLDTTSATEKRLWSDLLLAIQNDWKNNVMPMLQSRTDLETLNAQQEQTRKEFLKLWKQICWQAIEDYSVIGISSDRSAWDLALRELTNANEVDGGENPLADVNIIDLMAQGELFRGQWVSIEGKLLGARMIRSSNELVPSGQYYNLWIKPDESGKTPYNVYTLKAPEDFPEINEQMTEFSNPVNLRGIFFKVIVYTDSDNQGASCPFILAENFSWLDSPAANASQSAESSGNRWAIYLGVGGMVVAAIGICWFAITMERSSTRHQPKNKAQRVQNTMDTLGSRSDILDTRQRLAQLEQQDET
jgi:hypothetical protein